jgi:mono/diheme cytochrome c family protein
VIPNGDCDPFPGFHAPWLAFPIASLAVFEPENTGKVRKEARKIGCDRKLPEMTARGDLMRKTIGIVLALAGFLGFGVPAASGDGTHSVEHGRYLAAIMDCSGCHTPGMLLGKPDPQRPLAGSDVGFQIPGLGIFYPPNLTPDPKTGLGKWTAAQIITAVRTGVRPDGRILAPAMPYHSYAALKDDDGRALAAYLKTLKPVRNKVPDPVAETQVAPAPYLTVVMPK